MELEQIKTNWQRIKPPKYSNEELISINHIRKNNIFLIFKSALRRDLLISEVIAIFFVILLQVLNLKTSDFWSGFMLFIGLQHLIIYILQERIITRQCRFTTNIRGSIQQSINNLQMVLWHYRIWPALLAISLYLTYVLQFNPFSNIIETTAVGLGISILVLIVSYYLSAVLVRQQIARLKELEQEYKT